MFINKLIQKFRNKVTKELLFLTKFYHKIKIEIFELITMFRLNKNFPVINFH